MFTKQVVITVAVVAVCWSYELLIYPLPEVLNKQLLIAFTTYSTLLIAINNYS